jgi:hypothetical protein
MSVPIRAIALVFGQVVVVGAFVAASLGGQPNQRGKDIGEEVRERALQTRRDSPLEAPLAIIICFLPSAHPESKLVIRFKSRTDVRVESVRASVESSEAIRKLRGAGPVDIAAAVALMRVNRRELKVDPGLAKAWLTDFHTIASPSLAAIGKNAFDGTLQLDGTLYQLRYTAGEADITISVPGCEIGTDCTHDFPLVQWMENVRKTVEAMPDKAGK